MNLADVVELVLVWGLYPAWLIAGAGDYVCHRQTDIEHTSGSAESWFHLAQFGCLLIALAAAVFLHVNAWVFGIIVAAVVSHSMLAFLDVSYTDGRRHISPLEQTVHGFMDVLPLVAVALLGALHWPDIDTPVASPLFALREAPGRGSVLLIASFAAFAGLPILEELLRTHRHRAERARRLQAGLVTIK